MSPSATENGEDRLIIGVDFGTTYTGIAWTHSQIPDRRPTLNSWPVSVPDNQGRTSSDKVPTRLRYGKGGQVEWGFAISMAATPGEILEWFKLELETKMEGTVNAQVADRCHGHDPVKVTTDFLTEVAAHVRRHMQEALGPQVFSTTPVELSITVPAIWSHLAKDRTLKACEKAFGNFCPAWGRMPIHLISEPEAAAVYTLNGIDPNTLSVGETIIVMDAGGGTVDLISYKITSLSPLEVEEAAPGSGGKCGSTFLNKRYEALINKKLGSAKGFDKDVAAEVMDDFEKSTKRRFMADAGVKETYPVRVSGVSNNKKLGISRGRLNVTGGELHEVFKPVISDCLDLLQGQITASVNATGKPPKAVLLVGGFGSSVYLQHRVRELIRVAHRDTLFLTPPDAWQAVVQGAVMRGAVAFRSRKARMHYGMELNIPLHENHPDELKALACWDKKDHIFRVPKMHWILERGETIHETTPYRMDFCVESPVKEGPIRSDTTYIYYDTSDRSAPCIMDKDVKVLCSLEADLSLVPEGKMKRRLGKDGALYYVLDFHIEAVFLSAQIKYSLVYQGKTYDSVEADYL